MDFSKLAFLAFLIMAFSGCISDGDESSDSDGTSDGTDDISEPSYSYTDYECHVDSGAAVISFSGAGGNVGGCNLVTLSKESTVFEVSIPDGCTIEYNDGEDNINDGEAVIGESYPSGYSLSGICGAGVTNVDVGVTLETLSE